MVVVSDSEMDFVTMDVKNVMVRTSKRGQLSKSLSRSMPSIAHISGESMSALSSSTTSLRMISASRASERRFHRYFKQVPMEEHVLVHFRCALVRDILLQGHLYITPNHFAFYSNVFGYITKLLIPMGSITEINRQKKMKFVPNAVGIITKEEKHVLGSLFWKDSAFIRMKQIWEDMKDLSPVPDITPSGEGNLLDSEDPVGKNSEDNYDENDSGIVVKETGQTTTPLIGCTETEGFLVGLLKPPSIIIRLQRQFEPRIIIAILVVVLAALFISAGVVMMRIDRLHTAYITHSLVSPDHAIKRHFSKYLQQNLDQIVKVRENLYAMSQQFIAITESSETGPFPGDDPDLNDAPS